jgi:K(+)-stimulated pyrophosphate-energized sodium pump
VCSQYTTIAMVGVVILVAAYFLIGEWAAIGFVIGAVLSGLAGFAGMLISVRANVRTAQAASESLGKGLDLAFRSGAITGMFVAGGALLGVAGYYAILTAGLGFAATSREVIDGLVALGFGASLISIFARLGGGIFTKGADVGGDMVGKVEAGIPEDDPRNAATIADNVGDNVGDCAGMAADLFETYAVTTVATMVLAAIFFRDQPYVETMMLLPLAICGICVVTSIIGSVLRQAGQDNNIMGAVQGADRHRRAVGSGLIFVVDLADDRHVGRQARTTCTGMSLFMVRDRVCGHGRHGGDHRILHRLELPSGALGGQCLANGPRHQRDPGSGRLARIDGPAGRHHLRRHPRLVSPAGLYGIGIATTTMLGVGGDHRGARRLRSGHRQRRRHRRNVGPAQGSASSSPTRSMPWATRPRPSPRATRSARPVSPPWCCSRPISTTCSTTSPTCKVDFGLTNPYVVIGLFMGGMLPYLFAAMGMTAVGKAAGAVVEEVRRQFREIKGIMEGTAKPDYGRAVDMLTAAAIKEMIVPSLLPVLAPIALYVVIAVIAGQAQAFAAVGAMLLGTIVTGLFVAISMTSGGGAWDNAKKYIEEGHYGGKGSDAHKAAVTGDTVGDPYKDTAGPAVNPMIKIINIVAILLLAILAS